MLEQAEEVWDGGRTFVHAAEAAAAQDGAHLNALQAALQPHLQQVLVVVAERLQLPAVADDPGIR